MERQGRMTTAEDWGEGYRVSIVFFIIVKMINCGICVYLCYICATYMYIYIHIYTHTNIVYIHTC